MTDEKLLEQLERLINKQLKAEIEPIHERLDAQRDQINSVASQINKVEKQLSAQITREAEDLAELIRDEIFPKLTKHDEQIAGLFEEVGIKPRKH